MPDSTLSTLAQIQQKVRRLTRSPTENLLSTADLNNYINNFVLYDFPEHLRLWSLRTTFTFYTAPNVARYYNNATNNQDPLYNFKNEYVTFEKPVYCAGYELTVWQDRELFYGLWPKVTSIVSIGEVGDGTTRTFAGTLGNVPVLQNNVTFNSIDINNNPLVLVDYPQTSEIGFLGVPIGYPEGIPPITNFLGQINYVTGVFNLNFDASVYTNPPAAGQLVNSMSVLYAPTRPTDILFFDDYIEVRPVPDQAYPIEMEVYVRPLEFTGDAAQQPFLAQWWQWVAYGSAKKIFEDRMDPESLAIIMPEYKMQERLVLRTTLVQQTKERASTVYSDSGLMGPWGGGNWWWNNTF